MSKLNDQFKEIQTKLLKAEFFKLVKDNLSKIDSGKFKDVAKEVKDQVNAFLDAQVDIIESGEVRKEEITSLFTSDEVATLKLLAARASGKKPSMNQGPPPKQEPKKERDHIDTPDKISFALKHRNLGGKRVQINDKGSGMCIGLDAPYVVVKLDNGTTVEVLPQELIL